jgi:hypothetical protein
MNAASGRGVSPVEIGSSTVSSAIDQASLNPGMKRKLDELKQSFNSSSFLATPDRSPSDKNAEPIDVPILRIRKVDFQIYANILLQRLLLPL